MAGITTFTLARFERARVPALLASVPLERLGLRRRPGLSWGRHLGTSAGSHTLGVDPARWAWFCCWADEDEAGRFHEQLKDRLRPDEVTTLSLRTLRTRGTWAGHALLGPALLGPAPPADDADTYTGTRDEDGGLELSQPGPLVVLTRARVRAARWRSFTGAIPPVDDDLDGAPGRLRSVGVGEWPVLVQGTLSIWQDARAMTAFARTEAHQVAIRRTTEERWYTEELFARFSVERVEGTWDGSSPLGPV